MAVKKHVKNVIFLLGLTVLISFSFSCGHKKSKNVSQRSVALNTNTALLTNNASSQGSTLLNKPLSIKSTKEKIVIFSSRGGAGHISTSKSITAALSDKYDIKTVNTFTEVLHPMDPLYNVTGGKYYGENFYNYLVQGPVGLWTCKNLVVPIGNKMFLNSHKKAEKLFSNFLAKEKPSMIISVIPIINSSLLTVAKKMDVPFLVVTPDLDTTMFLNGLRAPDYNKFKYTLAYNDDLLFDKIAKAKFKKEQVEVVGFPVRKDFFEKKDLNKLRKEYNIPAGKKVIVLLMGGAGSKSTYTYTKKICKYKMPVHLLVCIGRNEAARAKIDKINPKNGVSKTVIGFTDRMSDLMAMADLLITKAGPNSISEAIYLNLPVLVDGISSTLPWEKINIKFVEKHKLGLVARNDKEIKDGILKLAFDEKENKKIRDRMHDFHKESFGTKIVGLVDRMVADGKKKTYSVMMGH